LPQGDFYLPEHDVVIERKEASDFASSTTDGRLSEQADRMIAEHDHVYVIIENDVGQYYDGDKYQTKSFYNLQYSHVGYKSLIGMQTSLAVKRDIKIIYTESVEHTIYAVNRVFERFMDDEHVSADGGYVKTADTGEVDDVQVAMLMQIDGISEDKAEEIIQCLGSIGGFIHAYNEGADVERDLKSIEGIGPTLADRVIDAFQ
jgi:ERCC4-type nuclease